MNRRFLAALALLAFIVVISVVPMSIKARISSKGKIHLIEHVAAFGLIFLLLTWGRASRPRGLAAAVALLAFGFTMEMVQTRVYRIHFEWWDFSADAVGVALGFLVWRWMPHRFKKLLAP